MKEFKVVTVLVSQIDQAENVKRMAERSQWNVSVEKQSDHFKLSLSKQGNTPVAAIQPEDLVCGTAFMGTGKLVVLESEYMGRGDDALGKLLMSAFVNTLGELDELPSKIIMFNSAVKLAVNDSPVLDSLQKLAEKNVEILVCGTCLEYLGLKDKLAVGVISNMFDIAESMLETGSVTLS